MGRGNGLWDEGETQGQGDGLGGPGQGRGGDAPENPTDFGTEKTKPPSQLGKGTYVGAYFMKGEPPKGEAAVQYSDVQRVYAEEVMDALQKQKVPAAYREYVRDYFDGIRLQKVQGADKK